ncbi:MAG: D-alanyl-D-alanine carboxypeptidase [Alphaproteobacteria bacterium]|nr:D-alanyl-D-alanine carboxypeptidase [Alphaproteobacteria bacterium]
MNRLNLCAAGAALALSAVGAQAAPALVVDAATGAVLHAEEATRPWFPASVTKLMTVYVALDAVRQGRLSLQTPLRVSARASKAAPSKMGFKPGLEVTLENALKIIMVKSANDTSITIAEGVSGSVEAFSAEMNRTARSLGMRESHFVNPNGLHHPSHVSSARDMAILARALLHQFPAHRELYGIGALQLGKRIIPTHNGLIGRYPGADGMKTGFVCASGFNVVATATRGNRKLIAVVFGAQNARQRTLQAMQLFDSAFAKYGAGQTAETLPGSGHAEAPNMRPEICGRGRNRDMGETPIPIAVRGQGYFVSSEDSPATFFAADRNRQWGAAPAPATAATFASMAASGGASLGPRVPLVPVPIYIGRAPGWNGVARGPASTEPVPAAASGVPARQAARQPAAAGASGPLRLPGAGPQAKPLRAAAAPRGQKPKAAAKPAPRGGKAVAQTNPRANPKAKPKPVPRPRAAAQRR